MFEAFAATLNCTGAAAGEGAVHSIVQLLAPGVVVREPARLCCTKVSALSTAPGISCARASSTRHVPACRPFWRPDANRAEVSGPVVVSADDSEVAVLVVPTNEEWQIAREALAVVRDRIR